MPTYEYQCKQCDERLEVFQSFSARPLRRHESCGGALEKVFHPSGIVFKGSGFYVTDSRGKSSSTTPAGSSSTSSTGDGSSSPASGD